MNVNLEKTTRKVIMSQGYYSLTVTLRQKVRDDLYMIHRDDYYAIAEQVMLGISEILARPYIISYRFIPEIFEVKTNKKLYRTVTCTNIHFHGIVRIDNDYMSRYKNRVRKIEYKYGYINNKLLYHYEDLLRAHLYMHKTLRYLDPPFKVYDRKYAISIRDTMFNKLIKNNKHIKAKIRTGVKSIMSYFQ